MPSIITWREPDHTKPTRRCATCGVTFVRSKAKGHFCSDECWEGYEPSDDPTVFEMFVEIPEG